MTRDLDFTLAAQSGDHRAADQLVRRHTGLALVLAGGYPRCHGCGGVPTNTPRDVWDPVLLSFNTLPRVPGPPYLFWEWVQNPGTLIARSRREPVCSRCWMSGPLHRYRSYQIAALA